MPAPALPAVTPDRRVLSRCGLRYRIRALRRSDEAALRAMFLRCSSDDLRLRCFGVSKTFPAVFAARLAGLEGPGEFAIAAVLEGGEIAGVVHAVGVSGAEADYDIMVRTDLKGQGIGTRLMREMLAEAGRSGFRTVHGDVLMGNRAMLLLAGDLGFRRVAVESGVVRIRATPARPGPAAPPPESPPGPAAAAA